MERESRGRETFTAPALLRDDAEKDQVFGDERKAFVCVSGGDFVLSEKAANCSLLSSSQPNTGGSEAALRLEDEKGGGGRVDRTQPEHSSAGQGVSQLFSWEKSFPPHAGKAALQGNQQQIHPWVKRQLLGARAKQGKRVWRKGEGGVPLQAELKVVSYRDGF